MKTKSKYEYGKIHANMLWAIQKLSPPTSPLKGNGHDRYEFVEGRRSCADRFLEANPAELMFLDALPDEHRAFVRVGRMNITSFISPQAMACWKQNSKKWKRLSTCRWYLKPVK